MSSIRLIRQLDDTGCGIACLAMITCQSYDLVKEKLYNRLCWSPRKHKFYTYASELMPFLADNNFEVEKATFKGWENIHGTAILGVNSKRGKYHWLVVLKDESRFLILDPSTAEIYQGSEWAGVEEDGYIAGPRSPYIRLLNHSVTHIEI